MVKQGEPHDVSQGIRHVHDHGAFAMQKDSRTAIAVQMIIHCGMGVLLGSLLASALILTDKNILQLIVSSSSPLTETAVFVGFFSFVIGMGAAITGFFFTVIELSSLEAKQQTKRVNQWRGPDNVK